MPSTPTTPATISAVTEALAGRPDGATVTELATATELPSGTVRRVLTELAESGAATRTPGSGKGRTRTPESWAPVVTATPDTDDATNPDATNPDQSDADADPATVTDSSDADSTDVDSSDADAEGDTDADSDMVTDTSDADSSDADADADSSDSDSDADSDADADGPDKSTDGAPSDAPVSPAPVMSADGMKVIMVGGVLGDHPDGILAADVVDQSGLRGQIVGRVLAAMERAKAAVRTTGDDGVETWTRGDADLSTVDLTDVATETTCPTCGHRSRVRNTVAVGRTSPNVQPGQTHDGQRILGRGELAAMVQAFLDAHHGHEFTAGTIGKELGRSSGAVANALAKMVTLGTVGLTCEAPMKYTTASTAPADTPDADTDDDADSDDE